jgi:hypothetical protein
VHPGRSRRGNGDGLVGERRDEGGMVSWHTEDQIIIQEVDGVENADRGQPRERVHTQTMLFRDHPYGFR